MLNLYLRLANWLREEKGQTLAEYALILALIAILLIGVLGFLQGEISNALSTVGSALNSATT